MHRPVALMHAALGLVPLAGLIANNLPVSHLSQ